MDGSRRGSCPTVSSSTTPLVPAWASCLGLVQREKACTCRWEQQGNALQSLRLWEICVQSQPPAQGPYRLVVRTSRCGCDNPGSTPGEDMYYAMFHEKNLWLMDAEQPNLQEYAR